MTIMLFKITEKDKKSYHLEKDSQKACLLFLKTLKPEGFFFKVQQGAFSKIGISDIIGLYKGWFCAFEVKSATGHPSALQKIFLSCVENAGGIGGIVRNPADVKTILNTHFE